MKEKLDKKVYFFVDESGDPNFFGRKKKDLVQLGLSTPYFIVGYIESDNQNKISKTLQNVRNAIKRFKTKWNHNNENKIRIFMQEPTQIAGLQVVDYILWTIHSVYNHGDMRYFHFLKDKIKMVHDIFIDNNFYGEYFSSNNELALEKIGIKK